MKGTTSKRLNRAGRARWAYVFDVCKDGNGKRKQITKSGFLTQREAQDALRKAMEEYQGKPAPAEERHMPTFAEFFEDWHTNVASRKWSRKTVERTGELAQYAIRLFGQRLLDQLSDEH